MTESRAAMDGALVGQMLRHGAFDGSELAKLLQYQASPAFSDVGVPEEWSTLSTTQYNALMMHLDPHSTGRASWAPLFLALALPTVPTAAELVAMACSWAPQYASTSGARVDKASFMATQMWFERLEAPEPPPAHLADRIAEMGFKVDTSAYTLREAALKDLLFDFLSAYCGGDGVGVPVLQAVLTLCADPDQGAGLAKAAAVMVQDRSGEADVSVDAMFAILHGGTSAASVAGALNGPPSSSRPSAVVPALGMTSAISRPDANSTESLKQLFSLTTGRPSKPAPIGALWAKFCEQNGASAQAADGWASYRLPDPFTAVQTVAPADDVAPADENAVDYSS